MLLLAPLPTLCPAHSQPHSAQVWDRGRPRWGLGAVPLPGHKEGVGHSPKWPECPGWREARACQEGLRPNSYVTWSSSPPLPGLHGSPCPVFRPVWLSQDTAVLQTVSSVKSDKAVPGSHSGASVRFLSMWVFWWLVFQFSNNTWWFCS